MSDYILTYSKIPFYPLAPKLDDIVIDDIAHALSLMTRGNGHCQHFYSVGQHSLSCSKEARQRGYSVRVQLACLLHDASESYISDITRPVKRHLTEYLLVEEQLQAAIYERFGLGDLSAAEAKLVRQVDDAVLYMEFEELFGTRIFAEVPVLALRHDVSLRDFTSVEQEFLAVFTMLMKAVKE